MISTSRFLPHADLGKCPIHFRVEIDLERLPVRADVHLRVHSGSRWKALRASQLLNLRGSFGPGRSCRSSTTAPTPQYRPEPSREADLEERHKSNLRAY
jgi:hypothetical protein